MALKVGGNQKFLSTANGKPALYGSGGGVAEDLLDKYSLNFTDEVTAEGYSFTPEYLYAPPSPNGNGFIGQASIATGHGLIAVGTDTKRVHMYDAEAAVESQENPDALLYTIDKSGDSNITTSFGYRNNFVNQGIIIAEGQIIVADVGWPQTGADNGRIFVFNLDGTDKFQIAARNTGSNSGNVYFGRVIAAGCGKIVIAPEFPDDRFYIYEKDGTFVKEVTMPLDPVDNDNFSPHYGHIAIGDNMILVSSYQSPNGGNNNSNGGAWVYDLDGNLLKSLPCPDNDVAGDLYGYSCAIGEGVIAIVARDATNTLEALETGSGYQGRIYLFDYHGKHFKTLKHFNRAGAIDSNGFRDVFIDGGRIYGTDSSVLLDSDLSVPIAGFEFPLYLGGIAVWDLEGGTIGYIRPDDYGNNEFSRCASVKDGFAAIQGNYVSMSPTGAVAVKVKNVSTPTGLRKSILGNF